MKHLGCKGQNLTEHAMILGVVVAAMVGMQTYIKRALQGQLKWQVDHWMRVEEAGNLPQECLDHVPPLTDPAECTQFYGFVMEDVEELEKQAAENAGLPPGSRKVTTLSEVTREDTQQTTTSYASTGTEVQITRTRDGTSTRVAGDAFTRTGGIIPPEFVRRASLTSGVPSGGLSLFRFPTPPPVIPPPPSEEEEGKDGLVKPEDAATEEGT